MLVATASSGESAPAVSGLSTVAAGVGEYRRHEPFVYRQAIRRSVYVTMRDGVRLAVDYYLPARDGKVKRGRFPVVLEYTRYGRSAPLPGGGTKHRQYSATDAQGLMSIADDPIRSELLLAYGYALVVADMRGSGASFGPSHAEGEDIEGKDGFDLVAWIARQAWSDGTVGMLGSSYLAEVQPRVAAERPPALKALSMVYGFFDGPNSAYSMGGIFRDGWQGGWVQNVAKLDNRSTDPNAPITNISAVDADRDQVQLRKAIDEHREGVDDEYFQHLDAFKTAGVVRDVLPFIDHYQLKGQNNLYTVLDRVNAGGVPTLLSGGWHDIYANDMLLWYANLTVPRKLIYGPYPHGKSGPAPNDPRDIERERLVARETLRWFDRWLRKMPNDAEQRPAVQFGLQRDPRHTEWFASDTWPPRQANYRDLYLSGKVSNTIVSQYDGSLSWEPEANSSRQPWRVDYSASVGSTGTRWGGLVHDVPVTVNDTKSLTYTSPPLAEDLYVAGIPVVKLWLSSENAPDADVHAYLNVVSEDGTSRLISDGMLRASHRTLGRPPYLNFGLPFPSSNSTDIAATPPLSATPVALEFTMLAVGRVFHRGDRLRLTIAGADRGNTLGLERDPAPKLAIHVGAATRSALSLRVLGEKGHVP
ncbi:CocE/NonD family hydrolase [Steroidobacter sp.]|uniref:CocE/NonD family hydrolase n=1 Tax=Steroidobacter sp. TaxID=1978227 RepID=UPI001A5FAA1B|nr:CocE/NonD family hydrolase [Steroidobacter sp.]MBL8265821.1 CocE/NonD family hydrolase [Steroidobacter sp.]